MTTWAKSKWRVRYHVFSHRSDGSAWYDVIWQLRLGSMRMSSSSQHCWPDRLCLWRWCVTFFFAKKMRAADTSTPVQSNSFAKTISIQFTQEVDHFTTRKFGRWVEDLWSTISSSHLLNYVEKRFRRSLARNARASSLLLQYQWGRACGLKPNRSGLELSWF